MYLLKSTPIYVNVSKVYIPGHKLLYNALSGQLTMKWKWGFLFPARLTCFSAPFTAQSLSCPLHWAASHWCLSGTLQRSRCMLGTIVPERSPRMRNWKLHYFFCSESVRRKKTVGNCALKTTGVVVMVVGRRLNATRFNRAETKATTG